MNAFDFLEQFGNIDGDYIQEAYEMKKTKRSTKRLFLTYLAAALAIAFMRTGATFTGGIKGPASVNTTVWGTVYSCSACVCA